jgi:hypothetical protein
MALKPAARYSLILFGIVGIFVGTIWRAILLGVVALMYLWLYPRGVARDRDSSLDPARKSLLTDRYEPLKVPDKIDVIVIGSGMAGLTSGAILSRMGKRVLVRMPLGSRACRVNKQTV